MSKSSCASCDSSLCEVVVDDWGKRIDNVLLLPATALLLLLLLLRRGR
jgi:hypothetical protein